MCGRSQRDGGKAFPNLTPNHFLLWIRSRQISLPLFSCSSSCFSTLSSPFKLFQTRGGWLLGQRSFSSTGGKRTSDHGMPLGSSKTLRIHMNNVCFTATLVILCLLTVLSRHLPPLYNALLEQSLLTFRSIFYTTVHQLCSGIETV